MIYVYTVPAHWLDMPREAYFITYDWRPDHAYAPPSPSMSYMLIL